MIDLLVAPVDLLWLLLVGLCWFCCYLITLTFQFVMWVVYFVVF